MILTILSFVLLIAGLAIDARYRSGKVWVGLLIGLAVITSVLNGFYLVVNRVTGEGINYAAIYHLLYGLKGASLWDYPGVLALSVFALLSIPALYLTVRHVAKHSASDHSTFSHAAVATVLALSIAMSPSTVYGFRTTLAKSSSTASTADFLDLYSTTIDPVPDQPQKNLVLLYLEGFEYTPSLHPEEFNDLTPNFDELLQYATNYTNVHQAEDMNFTIAGMVSSQCGIPLYSTFYGGSSDKVDAFMPGATCLGDLLSQQGYNLNYINGGDVEFAGKGNFYRTHSYDSVVGRKVLEKELDDPRVGAWGIYDEDLLDEVYREYEELSEGDQPFVLTSITLDTHPPYGYPSLYCDQLDYDLTEPSIFHTMRCSDQLVSEFVEKIRASEHFEDTVLVLISDHLLMNAPDVLSDYGYDGRRNRFMVFTSESADWAKEVDNVGSTLDISSTILPYIGYEGAVGLGRDLRRRDYQSIRNRVWQEVHNWKNAIKELWQFPTLEEKMVIDPTREMVTIDDGHSYPFPLTIHIADSGKLDFVFRTATEEDYLVKEPQERLADRFVMVESCSIIKAIFNHTETSDVCVLVKNGDHMEISGLSGIQSLLATDLLNKE